MAPSDFLSAPGDFGFALYAQPLLAFARAEEDLPCSLSRYPSMQPSLPREVLRR